VRPPAPGPPGHKKPGREPGQPAGRARLARGRGPSATAFGALSVELTGDSPLDRSGEFVGAYVRPAMILPTAERVREPRFAPAAWLSLLDGRAIAESGSSGPPPGRLYDRQTMTTKDRSVADELRFPGVPGVLGSPWKAARCTEQGMDSCQWATCRRRWVRYGCSSCAVPAACAIAGRDGSETGVAAPPDTFRPVWTQAGRGPRVAFLGTGRILNEAGNAPTLDTTHATASTIVLRHPSGNTHRKVSRPSGSATPNEKA
jgi:hypothetical protein